MEEMPVHGGNSAEACSEVCIGSPAHSQTIPSMMSSAAGSRVPISPQIDPTLANRLPPRRATSVEIQYSTMITTATYTPLLPSEPEPNTYDRLTVIKEI